MSALFDPMQLGSWLDRLDLAPGEPISHSPLSGGRSNAMFEVRRGGHAWVLRRPAGVAAERAEDGLRREFRILSALGETIVPHPRVVAFCDDRSVMGTVFYLVERVEGFAPLPDAIQSAYTDTATTTDTSAETDTDTRRAIALAMTDALAELHAVDPYALGLGDLGRPEGFHERQVSRWMRQLASYQGGDGLPGIETVTGWLEANRPRAFTPVLMHGDYHFGNVLMTPAPPPRVAAIVDWETATIGDPLLDLAGFLRIWFEKDPHDRVGWDELTARYAERSGREVPDLTYYVTLARFRLAVLLEGIHQRARHDPTRDPQPEMGAYARKLVADAVAALKQLG